MLTFWLLSVLSSNDLVFCVLSTIYSMDIDLVLITNNCDCSKISVSVIASLMITTYYFCQMLLLRTTSYQFLDVMQPTLLSLLLSVLIILLI